MVTTCCVPTCRSESYAGCNISFHNFPKNKEQHQKWKEKLNITRPITKYCKVCSLHFTPSSFHTPNSLRLLKKDALPRISPVVNTKRKKDDEDDSNKLDESENKYGYCRCCLAYDSHGPFENEHSVTLMQLNLFLVETPAVSDRICSQCVTHLNMVVEFRKKVMTAQQKLVEQYERRKTEEPVITGDNNPLPTTVLYIKEEELDLGTDYDDIKVEMEDTTDPVTTEKRQEQTSEENVCGKSLDKLRLDQNKAGQTTKGNTSKDQNLSRENCGQKNLDIEDVLQPYVITDKPGTPPEPTQPKPVKLTKIVLQKKNLIPLKKTTDGRVPILSDGRVILSQGHQSILKPRGQPIQNVVTISSSGQKDIVTSCAEKECDLKQASANKAKMPAVKAIMAESVNKAKVPASANKAIIATSVNKTVVPISVNKAIAPASVNKTIIPASVNKTVVPISVNKTIIPASVNKTVVPISVDKAIAPASVNKTVVPISVNKAIAPASVNKTIIPASVTKIMVPVSVNKATTPLNKNVCLMVDPTFLRRSVQEVAEEKRKCEEPTSTPVLTVEPLVGYDEETDSADEIEELSAEDSERPSQAKRRRIENTSPQINSSIENLDQKDIDIEEMLKPTKDQPTKEILSAERGEPKNLDFENMLHPYFITDVTYIRIGEKDEIATEVTKIRANITKLLQNSTATPFRTKCNMFQCFYCENVYTTFKTLKQHSEEKHKRDERKIFDSLQDIIIHADITDLRCGICRRAIKNIGLLVQHLQEHGKLLYELNEESRQPSYGVIGYKLYHGDFACHMCGKSFKSVDTLKYDMAEHYNVNTCLVCDKNFAAKEIFVFHLKVHQKEKCMDCLDPKRLSAGRLCAEHVRIANKLKEGIRNFDSVKKYLHLYNKTYL